MAFRWVTASADSCPTCQARNGKVRRDWGADFPAHPNCQCQVVQVQDDAGGMSGALRKYARIAVPFAAGALSGDSE